MQDAKPHLEGSREQPIALDETPPPSPRTRIKREEEEHLALLGELDSYVQQVRSPDMVLENGPIPKTEERKRGKACAECRARRVRCKHRNREPISPEAETIAPVSPRKAKSKAKAKAKAKPLDQAPSKGQYSSVSEDANYESIIKAVDSDDYVELACPFCQANCYINHRKNLFFFRGAAGLVGHISICHASQKWEGFRNRSVAERCVRRTLTAEEADAVRNGRHDVFVVDQVLASGAEEGSHVKKERRKRKRGEMGGRVLDDTIAGVEEDEVAAPPISTERKSPSTRANSTRLVKEPSSGAEDVAKLRHGHAIPGPETRASSMVTDNGKRARKTAPGGPLGHR